MTKPAREKNIADPKNLVDVTLLNMESLCFLSLSEYSSIFLSDLF